MTPSVALGALHQVNARLDALIEQTPAASDYSLAAVQARATFRMDRLRRFLRQLDDPLSGFPIVHIGGTSGKGSTSTALAAILHAAGYSTGLHTSPYLQVATEKLQFNGRLIAADAYVQVANDLFTAHERWLADGEAALTYGEAWFALMALALRDHKVDVAVVEVGAGGRFDLTNVLTPVLSVITSVGIDHTNTLGSTIEAIAWHKAGIIKPGIPAISAVTPPSARAIMVEEATNVGATLWQIDAATAMTDVTIASTETSWTESATGARHRIGLAGGFQAINGHVAVSAARALRAQGFDILDEAIATGLAAARIPGRAEQVPAKVPVLLDGAHNHDKMAALARDLSMLLPVHPGGRRIAVVGALEAKQADEMLALLKPHLDLLIVTAPRVLAKASREAEALAAAAYAAGFTIDVMVAPQPQDAIALALDLADPARGDAVLVTGSLYLVGNTRERWYPSDDIVLAQSSWPDVVGGAWS